MVAVKKNAATAGAIWVTFCMIAPVSPSEPSRRSVRVTPPASGLFMIAPAALSAGLIATCFLHLHTLQDHAAPPRSWSSMGSLRILSSQTFKAAQKPAGTAAHDSLASRQIAISFGSRWVLVRPRRHELAVADLHHVDATNAVAPPLGID